MGKGNIWQNYIESYTSSKGLSKFYNDFFSLFEDCWKKHLLPYKFEGMGQLVNGNRLRPMLVYWGYLLNKNDDSIFEANHSELEYIINFCIAVESIHKMSLLIDDLIDNDIARNGQTTFHVLHGNDTTILMAINILMKGFRDLYNHLQYSRNREKIVNRSIFLLLSTAFEMTKGALEEVNMDSSFDVDIDKVKSIIEMETSSIIKYGLQLGYNVGNGDDDSVEELLSEIGHSSGYIFQSLNDLEPFGNKTDLINHKGKLSTDILRNRKNIVVTYINTLGKESEVSKLKKLEDPILVYEYMKNLIGKYRITNIIYEEIDILTEKNYRIIDEIKDITGCRAWSHHFKQFIDILIKASKNRASEQSP